MLRLVAAAATVGKIGARGPTDEDKRCADVDARVCCEHDREEMRRCDGLYALASLAEPLAAAATEVRNMCRK